VPLVEDKLGHDDSGGFLAFDAVEEQEKAGQAQLVSPRRPDKPIARDEECP